MGRGLIKAPTTRRSWALDYSGVSVLKRWRIRSAMMRSRPMGPEQCQRALATGILGLVVTWLWVFSTHLAAHRNENLLLFNLLALALAVGLPAAVRGKAWAGKPARRLALAIAALAALGLLL